MEPTNSEEDSWTGVTPDNQSDNDDDCARTLTSEATEATSNAAADKASVSRGVDAEGQDNASHRTEEEEETDEEGQEMEKKEEEEGKEEEEES
ncbi:hypothetical protein ABVT39_005268 [Epinephelus coioides]